MERPYFVPPIKELEDDEVLVYFGNTVGQIQNTAYVTKFGAKYGNPLRGMNGRCYAIMAYELKQAYHKRGFRTVLSKEFISSQITDLYVLALNNPKIRYLVQFWGADEMYTGYTVKEMGELFSKKLVPKNIIFSTLLNDNVR